MTPLVIRRAEPADKARLIEICVAAQAQAFPNWTSDMRTSAEFDAQTRGEEIWATLRDGRAIGMVSIFRPRRFLHHLYVDPAFQGGGVGRALLAHAIAVSGGRLALKCDVDNRRACRFYQAMGMRPAAWGWAPTGPWIRFVR